MTDARKNHLLRLLQKPRLSRRDRRAIANDLVRLERRVRHAERRAMTDDLTKAPNPRAFAKDIQEAVRLFEQGRIESFGLVAIDLIGFKKINDRYGQSAGDAALKQFAEFLATAVRRPSSGRRVRGWRGEACSAFGDRRAHDRFYRRGGDEFNIIVSGLSADADAQSMARRLCRSFEFVFEDRLLHFSARAVAAVPRRGKAGRLERYVERRLSQLKQKEKRGRAA